MGGVSATASVIAIVQCGAQSIRAIIWLSDFCEADVTDSKDSTLR